MRLTLRRDSWLRRDGWLGSNRRRERRRIRTRRRQRRIHRRLHSRQTFNLLLGISSSLTAPRNATLGSTLIECVVQSAIIAVILASAVLVCVICHHALREGTVRVVVERKVVRRNAFGYKSIDAQIVHLMHTFLHLSVLLGTFAKILWTIGGTAPTIILEEARSCFA